MGVDGDERAARAGDDAERDGAERGDDDRGEVHMRTRRGSELANCAAVSQ